MGQYPIHFRDKGWLILIDQKMHLPRPDHLILIHKELQLSQ